MSFQQCLPIHAVVLQHFIIFISLSSFLSNVPLNVGNQCLQLGLFCLEVVEDFLLALLRVRDERPVPISASYFLNFDQSFVAEGLEVVLDYHPTDRGNSRKCFFEVLEGVGAE
ncbi:hypothetical protein GMDG_01603 [Pseudogymnoascus destructans 20631-21]|uniref:Uncharacterized protein n=1 Tax=Pseudogymnoascus destructans (strain ATCC MYA-4855 / 20631-21) TaxID=658429 RepID=L8FVX6_PSED2|nr:hypothetical protein GMDG_01603 [Pseudogymnoascus destructans 20631-21]